MYRSNVGNISLIKLREIHQALGKFTEVVGNEAIQDIEAAVIEQQRVSEFGQKIKVRYEKINARYDN